MWAITHDRHDLPEIMPCQVPGKLPVVSPALFNEMNHNDAITRANDFVSSHPSTDLHFNSRYP